MKTKNVILMSFLLAGSMSLFAAENNPKGTKPTSDLAKCIEECDKKNKDNKSQEHKDCKEQCHKDHPKEHKHTDKKKTTTTTTVN